ncbi:MAG: MGMT family protein [Patescibacteria group bacterium]
MKSKKQKTKPSFKEKIFTVVRAIPKGKILTYGEVARRVGSPNASRAVGSILKQNYNPAIPCHRVIRSDGMLGGYNRGNSKKARLLREEADEHRFGGTEHSSANVT